MFAIVEITIELVTAVYGPYNNYEHAVRIKNKLANGSHSTFTVYRMVKS